MLKRNTALLLYVKKFIYIFTLGISSSIEQGSVVSLPRVFRVAAHA